MLFIYSNIENKKALQTNRPLASRSDEEREGGHQVLNRSWGVELGLGDPHKVGKTRGRAS